jgi:hypothetical protein
MKENRKCVIMADGHTMSIQASEFHYCTPRQDSGPYSTVEVGFPDFVPSAEFMEYAEDQHNAMGTVYGYLPIEVLEAEIETHGGLLDSEYWWRAG